MKDHLYIYSRKEASRAVKLAQTPEIQIGLPLTQYVSENSREEILYKKVIYRK